MTYTTESTEIVYKGYYLNENGDIYSAETAEKQEKETIDKDIIDMLEQGGGKPQTVIHTIVLNKCKDDIKDLDGEQWKIIPNTLNGYLVSNYARVKSLKGKQAKLLKQSLSQAGYCRVDIMYTIGRVTELVHKLVAENFLIKPNEPFLEIHHKNGVKTDNNLSNLVYVNRKKHRELHKILNAEKEDKEIKDNGKESETAHYKN